MNREARSEIAMLEEYLEQLRESIDEFEHDARRCRDGLERAGDRSPELTRRLDTLKRNRDYNRRELERVRRRLAELQAGSGPPTEPD